MASSTSLQVAGLASNFDWKGFIDQIMAVEHQPADRLTAEKATNTKQSDLLSIFGTKLTALQTAAKALKTENLFGARTASSSTTNSTWSISADANTTVGSYAIAVSQLATKAQLKGATNVGASLSTTDTLANMATATAITAGTFTVNGKQLTLSSADASTMTFADLLTKIQTEAGLTSATYDAVGDTVSLQSAGSTMMLGASGDTSNVLQVLKLTSNGSGNTATSSGQLGVVKTTAALASANLGTAITGTDGSGNGSFSINGVDISYNVNSDTLATVVSRINASSAGVTAAYDSTADQLVLTSNSTGDYGIAVSDTTGTFAASLGLTSPAAWVQGKNALYTVNGGSTLTSTSNTLTSASHGITGLSLTVDSETTQTITVAADTTTMRSKIDSFISAYNDAQQFVDDETKITSTNGKVTTGPLATNREIQDWGRTLRSKAFEAISGLAGSVNQLDTLGIDFTSDGDLTVKDSSKLDTALKTNSSSVAEFFQTNTTGFADKFDDYVTDISKLNDTQQKQLSTANDGLDDQIAAIERRLDQQRSIMESAFIAMETAQSKLQQQQTQLAGMFASSSK